ncbi:MAG: hypothetical protein AB1726_13925 [Planctomycetota bacterium]
MGRLFRLAPLLAAVLPGALGACAGPATPSERVAAMYAENWEEQRAAAPPGGAEALARRRAERVAAVGEMLDAGELASATDRLLAASILKDADGAADVERARDLALALAGEGEDRALPVAAEAIDRVLFLTGRPQKYATQYVFDPLNRQWRLYDWDPATTDAERRAMGVVTLAEAQRRVEVLNRR